MKKSLASLAAILSFAAPAAAADMQPRPYVKAPPAYTAPQVVYNWTGFYIGGHIGGSFGGDNSLFGNDGRFLAGVQGGADYQFANNWVIGVEAQYSWLANSNSSFLFPGGNVVRDNDRGLGSVTGRLGYAWGPALLYAKGGYGFRDSSLGISNAGVAQPFAATGNSKDGYTVGAGLEYMFAPNWSTKLEYQYYNFGNTTFAAGSPAGVLGATFRNDEHTVKAGLNYRFGWGGPAVTRY